MNLRWLRLDYVDPQLPLTREQRRNVWHAARSVGTTRLTRLSLAHAAIPGVFLFCTHMLTSALFPGRIMMVVLGLVIGTTLTWIAMTFVGHWVWKPHVNKALREMGFDVCFRCGYWLRGLDSSTVKCPECGVKRDLLAKKANPS